MAKPINVPMTERTTRFITGRMCEMCDSVGWRLQDWGRPSGPDNPYRCTGCRRIVTNIRPAGGYTDDGDEDNG